MPLPRVDPIEPQRLKAAFDNPEWVFEIKYDGFRATAYIEARKCEFVSRNGVTYRRFGDLGQRIASVLPAGDFILDGELVCLDNQGEPVFLDLMHNRGTPVFAAFDLVWVNGSDIRDWELTRRKALLEGMLRGLEADILYVGYLAERGTALFEQVCARDLEGVVAKPAISPYRDVGGQAPWFKIKNPTYTQTEGRAELFNKRR